jgi:hypothetical protein
MHQIIPLTIIGARATSNASSKLQAHNVLTMDRTEWAVQVDSTKGLHTLTFELESTATIVEVYIQHGSRGRTFTMMDVRKSGDNSSINVAALPPGPSCTFRLADSVTSNLINLLFDPQHVTGNSCAAGLQYVSMKGYIPEPADENSGRAAKRR